MGKKKRYRGHYCKICASILPNERFSGGGHKNHICKKCSKKSPEEKRELEIINNISRMARFMNRSRNDRKLLEKYLHDKSERVRTEAKSLLEWPKKIVICEEMEWEYENMMELDSLDDEFWLEDEEELELSLDELDKLDTDDQERWFDDDYTEDELPFNPNPTLVTGGTSSCPFDFAETSSININKRSSCKIMNIGRKKVD
jgi:hypothetical protein